MSSDRRPPPLENHRDADRLVPEQLHLRILRVSTRDGETMQSQRNQLQITRDLGQTIALRTLLERRTLLSAFCRRRGARRSVSLHRLSLLRLSSRLSRLDAHLLLVVAEDVLVRLLLDHSAPLRVANDTLLRRHRIAERAGRADPLFLRRVDRHRDACDGVRVPVRQRLHLLHFSLATSGELVGIERLRSTLEKRGKRTSCARKPRRSRGETTHRHVRESDTRDTRPRRCRRGGRR